NIPEPSVEAEAVRSFEESWANEVVCRSLARLREKFRGENRMELFGVLERFLGEPAVTEEAARSLGSRVGGLRTAVSRLRKQFGEQIRLEIARTVTAPDLIEDEFRYLRAVLGRMRIALPNDARVPEGWRAVAGRRVGWDVSALFDRGICRGREGGRRVCPRVCRRGRDRARRHGHCVSGSATPYGSRRCAEDDSPAFARFSARSRAFSGRGELGSQTGSSKCAAHLRGGRKSRRALP